MTLARPVLAVLAGAVVSGPAAARGSGLALELHGGVADMTNASNSAHAVFDTSSAPTFGAGLRYLFGRRYAVSVGARGWQQTGQRVFVADATAPVFGLGHPLTVRVVPIQATLAYRFRPEQSVVPYVGVGGGVALFREESQVGGLSESNSRSRPSGHLVAGAEFGRGPLRGAVEAQFASVPDSIGVSGVSQVYGETDIGGFSVVAKLVLRLSGR